MPLTAPYDPSVSRLRLASTLAGTYTVVAKVRSFTYTEGTDGDAIIRWFGGDALRAGDATLAVSMVLWFDRGDTTGQELMRSGKRAGTSVFLQACPTGTATGEKCEQFECIITEFSYSSDATSNEAVEFNVTARGLASTLTTVTLP